MSHSNRRLSGLALSLCLVGILGCAATVREPAENSVDSARLRLSKGRYAAAVNTYSHLIGYGSQDPGLRSEYAYALARAGMHKAALYELDRLNGGTVPADSVRYFTGLALRQAGVKDGGSEFSGQARVPGWFDSSSDLKDADSADLADQRPLNERVLKASALSSDGQNYLACGEFAALLRDHPAEPLPWIGYSLALERIGAKTAASKALDGASIASGKNGKLQGLIGRRRQQLGNAGIGTREVAAKIEDPADQGRLILFAGGSSSKGSSMGLNGRIGYFLSRNMDIGADVGLVPVDSGSQFSFGVSSRAYLLLGASNSLFFGGRIALQESRVRYTISTGLIPSLGLASIDYSFDGKGYNAIGFTMGATKLFGGSRKR